MSKERRLLDLCPPTFNGTAERLLSVGHRCGYCQGNGWFWSEDNVGESTKVTCPVCQGEKEVDAVIDIHWRPSRNK